MDKGAKLNVKSKRGWTPLVIAEGVFGGAFVTRSLETAALLVTLDGAAGETFTASVMSG